MSAEILSYRTSDGRSLLYRRYAAVGAPRGIVVAVHGIQSHSGWYEFSSERLASRGWEVWFADRRGSGLNAEDRGHAGHADRLVHDVRQLIMQARAERPGTPVCLLGLSWGGRLAACVAGRYPSAVDGLILLYPAIFARVGPSWLQRALLSVAVSCGRQRLRRRIPLDDPALFTSNPEWQSFIAQDPLSLHEATVGFFVSSVTLEREAQARGARLAMPVLMMLAGGDRIIDNERTARWFETLPSPRKTLLRFDGAEHTLEFESCREAYIEQLLGWLANGDPRLWTIHLIATWASSEIYTWLGLPWPEPNLALRLANVCLSNPLPAHDTAQTITQAVDWYQIPAWSDTPLADWLRMQFQKWRQLRHERRGSLDSTTV